MAAQLLRTLSDPTAGPSSTSAATSAWDNSLGGAGEEVMHTAGALSVSGIIYSFAAVFCAHYHIVSKF